MSRIIRSFPRRTKPAALLVLVALGTQAAGLAEEWKELFNGKDLAGWVQRGGKASYTVRDGSIIGTSVLGTRNSFLCTREEYGDFILELEFRVGPELNCGVQVRSECCDTGVGTDKSKEGLVIAFRNIRRKDLSSR